MFTCLEQVLSVLTQKKKEELDKKLGSIASQNRQLLEEIEDLKENLRFEKDRANRLDHKKTSLEEQLNDIDIRNSDLGSQFEKEKNDLKEVVRTLTAEKNDLSSQNLKLKAELSEQHELYNDIKVALDALTNEKKNAQMEKDMVARKLEDEENQKKELNDLIRTLNLAKAELSQTISTLSDENKSLLKSKESQEELIKAARLEHAAMVADKKELQHNIDYLTSEISELQYEIQHLSASMDLMMQDSKEESQKYEKLEELFTASEAENQTLKQKIGDLEESLKKSSNQLSKSRSSMNLQKSQSIMDIQKIKSEHELQISQYQLQQSKLETECHNLQKELTVQNVKIENQNKQIENLNAEIINQANSIGVLKSQLESEKQQTLEKDSLLEEHLRLSQSQQTTIDQQAVEIIELKRQLEQQLQRIQQLEIENANKTDELRIANATIDDLKKQNELQQRVEPIVIMSSHEVVKEVTIEKQEDVTPLIISEVEDTKDDTQLNERVDEEVKEQIVEEIKVEVVIEDVKEEREIIVELPQKEDENDSVEVVSDVVERVIEEQNDATPEIIIPQLEEEKKMEDAQVEIEEPKNEEIQNDDEIKEITSNVDETNENIVVTEEPQVSNHLEVETPVSDVQVEVTEEKQPEEEVQEMPVPNEEAEIEPKIEENQNIDIVKEELVESKDIIDDTISSFNINDYLVKSENHFFEPEELITVQNIIYHLLGVATNTPLLELIRTTAGLTICHFINDVIHHGTIDVRAMNTNISHIVFTSL